MIYPDEFERTMRLIDETSGDEVEAHIYADDLLCETLRQLGYEKGVEIFENMGKWYA